jgi:hypothetical protein
MFHGDNTAAGDHTGEGHHAIAGRADRHGRARREIDAAMTPAVRSVGRIERAHHGGRPVEWPAVASLRFWLAAGRGVRLAERRARHVYHRERQHG